MLKATGSSDDCSSGGNGEHVTEQQQQTKEKQTEERRNKTPQDRPRRPLSAYNLFFKDERKQILESENTCRSTPGFESVAKTIGGRWKLISDERRAHYKALADADLQRYVNEVKVYEEMTGIDLIRRNQGILNASRQF